MHGQHGLPLEGNRRGHSDIGEVVPVEKIGIHAVEGQLVGDGGTFREHAVVAGKGVVLPDVQLVAGVLVQAHVVDQHGRRQRGRNVARTHLARVHAAHGQVQQHKLRPVEFLHVGVGDALAEILHIIDEHLDFGGRPFQLVHVVGVGERGGALVQLAHKIVRAVVLPVQGRAGPVVHIIGVGARTAHFHHVDFAAGGPLAARTQHPESGPQAVLQVTYFNAGFQRAVLEVHAAQGFQAGRGKVLALKGFALGLDAQAAVVDAGVVGPAGVVFQLLVAPAAEVALAAVAEVKRPVVSVDAWPVKVLLPD